MNTPWVLLDSTKQWQPYYPSDTLVTVTDYLQNPPPHKGTQRVLNLSADLSYRSEGYYCSLIAEARGHRALPSVATLNKLRNYGSLQLNPSYLKNLEKWALEHLSTDCDKHSLKIFFGQSPDPRLHGLFRRVYETYPAPILEVQCVRHKSWAIERVSFGNIDNLTDAEQNTFAEALDTFSNKIWRSPRGPKAYRYDLAILVDPEDPLPPSNKGALKAFVRQAKLLGMSAELISAADAERILEYDALLIRQTTALDNSTYKIAQQAEQSGMVVIDDPTSIVRCTNKVFLDELLRHKGIPMPASRLLFRENPLTYTELSEHLGSTVVLKVPDGSFSIGVSKVSTQAAYEATLEALFAESAIVIAQAFVPTDFDWRIGILAGEPLYACKYHMARGHWQIYNHSPSNTHSTKSGGFETLSVHAVPRSVLKTALKAANLIGKGLYGVDLKQVGDECLVIEVNDNPSIDHGVEDKVLGDVLYRRILDEMLRRLDQKRHRY